MYVEPLEPSEMDDGSLDVSPDFGNEVAAHIASLIRRPPRANGMNVTSWISQNDWSHALVNMARARDNIEILLRAASGTMRSQLLVKLERYQEIEQTLILHPDSGYQFNLPSRTMEVYDTVTVSASASASASASGHRRAGSVFERILELSTEELEEIFRIPTA